jgi:hypothetical protein
MSFFPITPPSPFEHCYYAKHTECQDNDSTKLGAAE